MPDRELVPTQSAFLELKAERAGMQEGYRFLDEKRLILASEILSSLRDLDATRAQWQRAQTDASAALRAAVGRHGLEELAIYPSGKTDCGLPTNTRSVLGVRIEDPPSAVTSPYDAPADTKPVSGALAESASRRDADQGSGQEGEQDVDEGSATAEPGDTAASQPEADVGEPANLSPEAEQCRLCFTALAPIAARLAVLTGNLERLRLEYVRTARRARALEDVLLPEIDERLAAIDNALEEQEREESVRVRRAGR
jgi:V/A-type H+-transporting ATPase subunit D